MKWPWRRRDPPGSLVPIFPFETLLHQIYESATEQCWSRHEEFGQGELEILFGERFFRWRYARRPARWIASGMVGNPWFWAAARGYD